MALHDLIGARSSAKSPDELPAELKPVIRLISGD
jgi:hypothetical protein